MEKKQTFGELFRRWGLKSIKLNVKFAQLEFEATDDDMTAAWDMYVELITRIATQELDEDCGDEKAALNSIHALFPITREILKSKGRLAPNFTKIAVVVLNQILRPFLSKWHRRSLAGDFENPQMCIEFRKELENIRIQLLCYSRMLAEIAKVEPKTQASNRTIYIDADTIKELQEWKAVQAKVLPNCGFVLSYNLSLIHI